ncbi:MAG: hypothetical protein J0L75_04995 [Spirochaetes bacterium]|nr:hypothetical protein [Spirochaetota bacterium]
MAETKPLGPDPEGRSYGPELARVGSVDTGPLMAVAISQGYLYAAGVKGLMIFSLGQPRAPRLVGSLAGLGKPRQLVVSGRLALVSARENGLFVVEVSDPTRPRLLAQYDSIELATGVALSGEVVLLACRQFGVEIVDLRDPSQPRHLGVVRTGEAQSVTAHRGIGYAGVWGTREVVSFDLTDPRAPRVLARIPLDGFGDGLCVAGEYLLAATGHHTRDWKYLPTGNPDDPGFGRGHGLEVFSLQDPARPRLVSRFKLPRLYSLHWDMWGVEARGHWAFVGDTHNGLCLVDLRNPGSPVACGWHRLPPREAGGQPEAIGGFAVGKGVVYLAGGYSGLVVVDAEGYTPPAVPESDPGPQIPAPSPATDARFLTLASEGQVHSVAVDPQAGLAYLASGNAGVEVWRTGATWTFLARHPMAGIAYDVALRPGQVLVAEGLGGLGTYAPDGAGGLRLLARYQPGETVKQVVAPAGMPYVLLHVGINLLQIIDMSRPETPRVLLEDRQLGPLYGRQISGGLLQGRYASCFWQVGGFRWYDLAAEGGPRKLPEELSGSLGYQNGMAMLADRALVSYRQGYCLVERTARTHVAQLPRITLSGVNLDGKPVIDGDTLYLSERGEGRVTAVDIHDPSRPALRWQIELTGHPGPVVPWQGGVLIPAGYQGLLVYHPKE